MSLRPLILFTVFLFSLNAVTPLAYGQHAQDDTLDMSLVGKNAKVDEYFFDAVKAKIHNDDKKAMELLLKYVSLRQDVPAAYYELARISHGDRNLVKAEEYIKRAIELNPANKWYRELHASVLADKGSFAEAADIVADLMKKEPQDDKYPIIAADYYTKAKMFDKAIACIDAGLVRHANNEDLLDRKIQVYLAMNNVEKAADVVRQMIREDAGSGRYYIRLADIYENNKMPAKAGDVYKEGLKKLPNDVFLRAGYAEYKLRDGDTATYKTYTRSLLLDKDVDLDIKKDLFGNFVRSFNRDTAMTAELLPIVRQLAEQHNTDDDILLLWGELLEMNNQKDSAIIAYKLALKAKPNNADLWNRLLSGMGEKKYADSLIKSSERAMRLFPSVAVYSYFNAIGYMNKKQYPQAINAIRRAIDMQPDNNKALLADMYSLLADLYHSNKQDDLSDKAFDKALSIDPGNASTLNNYAYYLSERGKRLDQAEEMSKKSLDLQPNVATYMDTYGWIQYKKGNYLKAKDFVERAIKLNGAAADATLYDHLGDICYQLNDRVKAVEYWKKAKELGSDNILLEKKISEGKLYE